MLLRFFTITSRSMLELQVFEKIPSMLLGLIP